MRRELGFVLLAACGKIDFAPLIAQLDARAADVAPDAPPQLLETLTVQATGETATSAISYATGVHYQLRSSGTWIIAPYADTEYTFSQPDGPMTGEQPDDLCDDGFTDAGLAIDDLVTNGQKSPKWGAYRMDHIYTVDYIGTGAPLVANIHDTDSANNSGTLTLEIFAY